MVTRSPSVGKRQPCDDRVYPVFQQHGAGVVPANMLDADFGVWMAVAHLAHARGDDQASGGLVIVER